MSENFPNNWVDTELENLFHLIYGKGLRVKELTEKGYDVYGANGIIGKYDSYLYENSKIIISCRGAASGAIHKTNKKSFITSNSIVLDEYSNDLLNLDYAKYAMEAIDKSGTITGTAQPQITIQLLKNIKFPLAPFPEQQRIASKLDNLFSQFEDVKTRLDKIPELLKKFRQALLSQAVTGKLTGSFVIEKRLGDLLEDVKYGTSKKSKYDIKGTPIFRIPNINVLEGEIDDNDLKFSILSEVELVKLKLKEGDVLIIRSNGSVSLVGQTAIIRKKHEGYSYAGYLIRLRCTENLNAEYLNYILKSNIIRSQIVDTSRSTNGINNINSQEIKEIKILCPSIKDQKIIVERIKNLFKKASLIENQYITLKEKIDTIPQSILYKAFKGELVEQLPSDGNARDLLKQIKKLKEEASLKVKKKATKNAKKGITKEQKINKLKSEIKNILIDNHKGITFNELIEKFNNNEDSNLVSIVIEKLISNKSITQYFNSDKKEMRIRINL